MYPDTYYRRVSALLLLLLFILLAGESLFSRTFRGS